MMFLFFFGVAHRKQHKNTVKNLDLRLFDAKGKSSKRIRTQMVVNNGDESHGTILKKNTNKTKSKASNGH